MAVQGSTQDSETGSKWRVYGESIKNSGWQNGAGLWKSNGVVGCW